MTTFPLRLHHERLKLPARGSALRETVSEAVDTRLEVSPSGLEILSMLSGRFLRKVQRQILGSLLIEHLQDTTRYPSDLGQLSQGDVLGASLGLACFAALNPGDWTFVRIPEGPQPSVDVFAYQPGGRPWFIEFKSVAPLGDVDIDFEACKQILAQRRVGLKQLEAPLLVGPGPSIFVSASGGLVDPQLALGGRALSIVVLPDAALITRSDISAPVKQGCPGPTCAEKCLKSGMAGFQTSPVALLWQQPNSPPPTGGPTAPDDSLRRVLETLHDLNLAMWTDSARLVDQRLVAFSSRATALLAHAPAPDRSEFLARVISAAAGSASTEGFTTSRQGLPSDVIERLDARLAGRLPAERRTEPVIPREALKLDDPEPQSASVESGEVRWALDLPSANVIGTLTPSELRVTVDEPTVPSPWTPDGIRRVLREGLLRSIPGRWEVEREAPVIAIVEVGQNRHQLRLGHELFARSARGSHLRLLASTDKRIIAQRIGHRPGDANDHHS